eukprot:tig00000459_g1155.t1
MEEVPAAGPCESSDLDADGGFARPSGGRCHARGDEDLPPVRILAIDGGGTRGIIPAKLIEYISRKTGRPIHELFDYVAGSSIGGILACGTFGVRDGRPLMDSSNLVQELTDAMQRIFSKSPFSRAKAAVVGSRGPFLSPEPFEKLLAELGSGARLTDVAAFVLVTAFDIEERSPLVFSTAQALRSPAHNVRLCDIALATSAAPLLFPPARLHIPGIYTHKDYGTFIDGWLVQNNPSLLAYAEAARVFPGRKVLLLNLGTGDADEPLSWAETRQWGALRWIEPLFQCMLGGANESAALAARQLLGDDFLRLSPRVPPEIDRMADASPANLTSLARAVETQVMIILGLPSRAPVPPDHEPLRRLRPQLLTGDSLARLDAFVDRLVAASDHPGARRGRPHAGLLPRDFAVQPRRPAMAAQPVATLSDAGVYGTSVLSFEDICFWARLPKSAEAGSKRPRAGTQRASSIVSMAQRTGSGILRTASEALGIQQSGRVPILRGVSGSLRPRTMTLILGPALSGKSALLRILAKQHGELRRAGFLDGKVYLDGKPAASRPDFNRRVIFVSQLDSVHYPQLTVEETLRFAARMKRPHGSERDSGDIRSADVRAMNAGMAMHLSRVKDSIVGDQAVRGISGGEKRRLSVAVQLAAGAYSVILMDQPTDGLDASASLELCRALRELSLTGASVLCSLLQPSWELYEMFDRLILLSNGDCLYNGPGRLAPVEHFEAHGFTNAEGLSPPDFLVSVAAKVAAGGAAAHDRLPLPASLPSAPKADPPDQADISDISESRIELKRRYPRPWHAQIRILYARSNQLLFRNPKPAVTRFVETAVISFVLATLFCNTPATMQGATNRIAFFQASLLVWAFTALNKIEPNYEHRRVMHKQAEERMYRPDLWVIAHTLSEIPRLFCEVLLFSLIVYFAVGLQPAGFRFGRFLLVIFQMTLIADASILFLSLSLPRKEMCSSLAPVVPAIFFIFGGFLVPKTALPSWWVWARYLSFYSYPLEALAINELLDIPLSDVPGGGTAVLEAFGFQASAEWYGYNVLVSFAYWILWLVASILAALHVRSRRPFSSVPVSTSEPAAANTAASPGGSKRSLPVSSRSASALAPTIPTRTATRNSEASATAVDPSVHVHVSVDVDVLGPAPVSSALTFVDVSYFVPGEHEGETKRLLDNVTGVVESGTLTALMGESGSGKTTLLDVLANRKTTGKVTGEIKLNGRPRDDSFKRVSGYVEQFDLLFPTMTVREAVVLSALLRLDARTPRGDKIAAAEGALRDLDLEPSGRLVIGTLQGGGIPVEMRKRVCIAMELVPRPAILFLDEPTTGLDSTAALRIGQLLRRIAGAGQATVATMHQPSGQLFGLFDRLILLRSGGVPIYSGELGQRGSGFFAHLATLGFELPPFKNAADWAIEIAGGRAFEAGAGAGAGAGAAAECDADVDAVAASFREGPPGRRLRDRVAALDAQLVSAGPAPAPERPPFARQVAILAGRKLRWLWRERETLAVRVLSNVLVAVIAGTAWYQLGGDQPGARLRLSALYALTLYFYFRAMAEITMHCALREVYYREKSQGIVSPLVQQVSDFAINASFALANTVLFCVIMYPLVGFQLSGNLAYALLVCCAWTLACSSFTELLALALPIAPMAMSVASGALALGAFFTGFMMPGPDMPRAYVWLYYLLWFRYPFEGLAASELSGLVFSDCPPALAAAGACFPDGAALLARYDLRPDRQWANVGILAGYWLAFEALKGLALHRINHLRR